MVQASFFILEYETPHLEEGGRKEG